MQKTTDTASPPAGLVQALLYEAGIHDMPGTLSLLGVSTCSVWALHVDGRQYVVRQRLDGDTQLAHKEAHLSDLLRGHGVPAANVLAVVAGEHGVATLTTWLPGISLEKALASVSGADLRSAWRSAGEMLRKAHEIVLPQAGEIVGDQIAPFPGGWARWVLEDLAADVAWLQEALKAPKVDPALLEQVTATSIAALDAAPVRLIHNDALPQNILIDQGAGGWVCTGWLDWEFARAGDPRWDLATLDFRPARLAPPALYDGYGAQSIEPQASIYDLLMATWRTRAELEHGSHWEWPPQPARIAYLRTLPEQIERLAGLLGV